MPTSAMASVKSTLRGKKSKVAIELMFDIQRIPEGIPLDIFTVQGQPSVKMFKSQDVETFVP